jgi:predicted ribosome quality control (RQC) complex YloA/Tae2 family protein
MTRLVLDLNKSIEENASNYFDKAKKIKKKIAGAEIALRRSREKLKELESKKEKFEAEEQKKSEAVHRKKEWYEKFRWFKSSDGFLIIGGRDATSNEIVIKKHTGPDDLVFHTDLAGSPFFVIKSEGKKIPNSTIKEVADATCTFSRVWKLGLQSTDVFYVKPEQVSKKAKSGEYMSKGAFMIYGKTDYIDNKVNLAVGITKDKAVMAGPLESIKKNCKKFVDLKQGDEKVSSMAKKINYKLGKGLDLDEIIRVLPAGNFKLK